MTTSNVRDNAALSRFELDVEGAVAFANYRRAPGTVIIIHTETPRALRGHGIASELVQGALQLIRADGAPVAGIHVFLLRRKSKTWMAGTSSAKTRFALLPGHDDRRLNLPVTNL